MIAIPTKRTCLERLGQLAGQSAPSCACRRWRNLYWSRSRLGGSCLGIFDTITQREINGRRKKKGERRTVSYGSRLYGDSRKWIVDGVPASTGG